MKTISTEGALKYVLELRATHDGPDREEYVAELDRIIDDFRRKHGPEIPAAEAYAVLKELETQLGRAQVANCCFSRSVFAQQNRRETVSQRRSRPE